MSENLSQNTANDFLDQTFKDIDSSVSLEESDENATQAEAKSTEKKAGGLSSNAIIIGGVAVAALVVGGYMYLNGGQPAPVQQEQAPQETLPEQPAISFTEPSPAPEIAATAEVVQVAVQPEPLAIPKAEIPANDQLFAQTPAVDPFAATANISTVVMPEAIPQLSEPVPSVANETLNSEVNSVLQSATVSVDPFASAPVQAVIPTSDPVIVPVAVEPIQAIATNAAQTAHVDELRGLFDKHSVEIDKLDIRVTALEAKFDKSIQEQMAINKRVDERLAKLEAGGVGVAKSSSASSGSSDKVVAKNNQRKRVKKASTRKQAASSSSSSTNTSKVTVTNEPKIDSTTLVDKREVVSTAKPKAQTLNVHSVFSSRLWIKNPDSTLSTFAVGEAIPGGEKIKRIDEVSRKIYTDKRVIAY